MSRDQLKESGKQLFRLASGQIPNAKTIVAEATEEIMAQMTSAEEVKANFSNIVSLVQSRAYDIYQEKEAHACSQTIREFLQRPDSQDFNQSAFTILDSFFLSLVQSRKPRAGSSFESIVTTLFERLGYPFTAQPNLGTSRPDFVIPSIEYYHQFAADCIIFTCKRTLRERWRQVLTEGISGKAFYLATMDDNVSGAELDRIKGESVYLVVPTELKESNYESIPNVITFEVFLKDHLDPSIQKWHSAGLPKSVI